MTSNFVFGQLIFVFMSPLQDGNWSKEEKMSASLHDTDEDHPYGYIVPQVP